MTIQEDLNMENIIKILSDLGTEVPEDKQAELNKAVAKNYKTVVEFENKVNKLTEERDTAVETLKGFEGKDFDAITKERDEWKRKHDENEEKHRKEQEERDMSAAIEALLSDVKFTSPAAKRDVVRQLREKKLTVENGVLLGGKDALDAIQKAEPESFDDEDDTIPRFTSKNNGSGKPGGRKLSDMTVDERIKLKHANPKLYESMKKENK